MKNDNWYKNLNKSKLTPPSYVFSIVWPILYILMIISLIKVWRHKSCYPYCSAITYFFIQLFFNIIWTTLFFKMKNPTYALFDIILLYIFVIITYKKFIVYSNLSAKLLIPYILWISFASYLNIYIVLNN